MNEWEMSRDSLRKFENLPLSSNLNVSEKNENFYLKSLSPGNKLFLFAYNLILILFYIIFFLPVPQPLQREWGVGVGGNSQSVCAIKGIALSSTAAFLGQTIHLPSKDNDNFFPTFPKRTRMM